MKRLLIFLVLFLAGGMLFAQSLRDTEEYKKLQEAKAAYQEAYARGDYEAAYTHARDMRKYAELLDRMAQEKITGTVSTDNGTVVDNGSTTTLPPGEYIAEYVVKKGDCLWLIAGRKDVYDNPRQWPEIWKANKDKLRDPENPRLIHPGMRFTIPSLSGEVRSGTK